MIAPYIFKVVQDILGTSGPAFSFTWFGFTLLSGQPAVSLSPLIIAVLLLILGVSAAAWVAFKPKAKAVSYNTWDCGYYKLDSRNEYTATGFSKPFRIAFNFFLMPYSRTEKLRKSFYYIKSFRYETFTTPIFKKYMYYPLIGTIFTTAKFMRRLQSGSIHMYISYIFITILMLIIFMNRF